MSDPVTNTEIEDVLTSIRRLVSENRPLPDAVKDQAPARPVAFDTSSAQDESAEDETPVAEAPLALVLTPALRVEDAPDAEGDVDADEPQDVVDESDDLDEVEIDPSVDVDQVAAKVEPDAVEAVDAEQKPALIHNLTYRRKTKGQYRMSPGHQ